MTHMWLLLGRLDRCVAFWCDAVVIVIFQRRILADEPFDPRQLLFEASLAATLGLQELSQPPRTEGTV